MLTYKNILIAVDGSHEAEWAFNKAVDVANRNEAKLTVVNVIDSRTYSSYEVYDAQFTEKSKNFSDDLLKGYKEVATNAGIKDVETRLEFGSPKAIIPKKLASEVEADLIMCGTSGLNAVESSNLAWHASRNSSVLGDLRFESHSRAESATCIRNKIKWLATDFKK